MGKINEHEAGSTKPTAGQRRVRACGLAAIALAFALTGCSQAGSSATTSGNNDNSAQSSPEATANTATTANTAVSNTAANAATSSGDESCYVKVSDLYGKWNGNHEGVYVLDVRSLAAFYYKYIDGCHMIPAGKQLSLRTNEIPTEQDIYIVSDSNERSLEARDTLLKLGYDQGRLFVVDGGIDAWEAAGYPLMLEQEPGC